MLFLLIFFSKIPISIWYAPHVRYNEKKALTILAAQMLTTFPGVLTVHLYFVTIALTFHQICGRREIDQLMELFFVPLLPPIFTILEIDIFSSFRNEGYITG